MKLKIINSFLAGAFLLMLSSCLKPDNYAGPDASLQGNVFDQNSDSTVETCSGNFSIRLEQLSWSSNPTPQDIPIKTDGTYENTELFSGHYRVSIYGAAAFWPVDSVEMDIHEGSKYDFHLTPYLYLRNFTAQMADTTLNVTFNLEAPIDGIPDIAEIQVYTNTTQIVGPGASILALSD